MEPMSKTRMRLLVTVEEEAKQGQAQCLLGELCTVARSLVSGKVIGQCVTSHTGATSKVFCKALALSCQARNLLWCQHPFPPTCYSGGKAIWSWWSVRVPKAALGSAASQPQALPTSFLVVQVLPNSPLFTSLRFGFLCLL